MKKTVSRPSEGMDFIFSMLLFLLYFIYTNSMDSQDEKREIHIRIFLFLALTSFYRNGKVSAT